MTLWQNSKQCAALVNVSCMSHINGYVIRLTISKWTTITEYWISYFSFSCLYCCCLHKIIWVKIGISVGNTKGHHNDDVMARTVFCFTDLLSGEFIVHLITGEFPSLRACNVDPDVSLMLVHKICLTNCRMWFETTWRSCDVIVMTKYNR